MVGEHYLDLSDVQQRVLNNLAVPSHPIPSFLFIELVLLGVFISPTTGEALAGDLRAGFFFTRRLGVDSNHSWQPSFFSNSTNNDDRRCPFSAWVSSFSRDRFGLDTDMDGGSKGIAPSFHASLLGHGPWVHRFLERRTHAQDLAAGSAVGEPFGKKETRIVLPAAASPRPAQFVVGFGSQKPYTGLLVHHY